MNRRLLLAALGVGLLAATGGCLGFNSGPVADDRLDQPPAEPYEWNASTDVHITVTESAEFRAVYAAGNRSLELYRNDGFGGRNGIPVRAVRYRYPNGTVVNGSAFAARGGEVRRTGDAVRVVPPDGVEGGKLAFTSESTPKRFTLPVFLEGSYEVVLPPDRRVDFFLFGNVAPPADERFTDDRGRTHLRWSELSGRSLAVQFYLERDLPVFGGIVALLAVVGLGGTLYYRRKIRRLQRQREAMGLDVDTEDDDFGRDPPPGMG